MNKKLSAVAIAVAVFAMACSDPTTPMRALPGGVTATVLTYVDGAANFPAGLDNGEVRVCKAIASDDPAQRFNFSAATSQVLPSVVAGAPINFFIDAVPGQTVCADIYDSAQPATALDRLIIVEGTLPSNWTNTNIDVARYRALPPYTSPAGFTDSEDEATRTATVYVNSDEGRVVTFTNDLASTGCTYTKGWYRNNGSNTVIAVDGRTVADAQAIFNATPGKPGLVTWNGGNDVLNLYQQFLAALQNLGGDANEDNGPPAVDQAIDDAQAGFNNGPGKAIVTTLTQSQVSALITTLSNFNEGDYAGWPHCAD